MSLGDVYELYFEVDDEPKSYEILDLNASIKANKIIRDNAYLSFPLIKDKKLKNNIYSDCWLDFIKNKKINIKTSGNNITFVKKSMNKYIYRINLDPSKIKILNVSQNSFLSFCNKF
jgi:hypothetical protein